jgi:hypothetical protein
MTAGNRARRDPKEGRDGRPCQGDAGNCRPVRRGRTEAAAPDGTSFTCTGSRASLHHRGLPDVAPIACFSGRHWEAAPDESFEAFRARAKAAAEAEGAPFIVFGGLPIMSQVVFGGREPLTRRASRGRPLPPGEVKRGTFTAPSPLPVGAPPRKGGEYRRQRIMRSRTLQPIGGGRVGADRNNP